MLFGAQLQVVWRNKPSTEPTRDVIENRGNETDARIRGDAGRLESRVHQLVDEDLQRHTVLQTVRDGESEAVHDAGERGAFLGHLDEDFTGPTIFVHANGDVAFVATDAEFVRHRGALDGHFLALLPRKQFALHGIDGRDVLGFL